MFHNCCMAGALIVAVGIGILLAFMIPAWFLVVIEAMLIVGLGCCFLRL